LASATILLATARVSAQPAIDEAPEPAPDEGAQQATQPEEPIVQNEDSAPTADAELDTATAQNAVPAKPSLAAPAAESAANGNVESNVISLADREGFRWQTRTGDFVFNPYILVQAYAQGTRVSNRWLNLADQDTVRSLGFGTANALLGVAGRGFEHITFNLALNAACSGPCLLNQAWMNVELDDSLNVRVGKLKTPMHWAYQVRVGHTGLPRVPVSLASRVNLPFGLNAVNPTIGVGFDTGVMAHGVLGRALEYQVGVFNGEGINTNVPTSTLSDDRGIPGLLYAARIAYQPLGRMRPEEGGPPFTPDTRLLLGASSSYNIEANAESSDDWRGGAEFAVSSGALYLAVEGYVLRMAFVERQRGTPSHLFWGSYAQMGVALLPAFEPVVRVEVFDRDSTREAGLLLIPAVGVNWYIVQQNFKLQLMYQTLRRLAYSSDIEAHQDDNAIADHSAIAQLQFAL
jgi:hypothetical protein